MIDRAFLVGIFFYGILEQDVTHYIRYNSQQKDSAVFFPSYPCRQLYMGRLWSPGLDSAKLRPSRLLEEADQQKIGIGG